MNRHFPMVRLGEVLQLRIDAVPVDPSISYMMAGVYSFGRGLFKRAPLSGTETTYRCLHRLHKDHFVISQPKAWEGALARVPMEFDGLFLSSVFPTFRAIPDHLDVRYLEWYCKQATVWEELRSKARGMGARRESVLPNQFLSLTIPLPTLSEQRRIVAKIDELTSKIEEAEGLRRQSFRGAEVLFETTMKVIFNFIGTKKRVKDFASVLGGYAFSSDQYTENGSHQIVRIGNVRDGYLDLSRAPVRWDFQDGERSQKYELKGGDILISMTGTRNKRDYGYVAIVPSGQKLLLNQRVGKMVLHKTLDRQYLYYFLRSPFFRDNLFPHATGTANQANIGNKHIEDVPFEPPENLEEQRRIAAYLGGLQTKIQGLKQLQAQTDVELNALMPSILDKAFKGEL